MNNSNITDVKDVYQVVANTDQTEGKGSNFIVGTYWNPVTANRNAWRKGVMGSKAPVFKVTALLIDNQWYIPGDIEYPTAYDIAEYEVEKENKAIEARMLAAGFTAEEISRITRKTS